MKLDRSPWGGFLSHETVKGQSCWPKSNFVYSNCKLKFSQFKKKKKIQSLSMQTPPKLQTIYFFTSKSNMVGLESTNSLPPYFLQKNEIPFELELIGKTSSATWIWIRILPTQEFLTSKPFYFTSKKSLYVTLTDNSGSLLFH